jgi:RHS repeat-associated protein
MMTVTKAYRDPGNSGTLTSGSVIATCSYDGKGRRIKKAITNDADWIGTYLYYYDGDSMIETRNGSGIVAKQQVWGTQYIDELVQLGVNQHATVDDPNGNAVQRLFWTMQDANYNVLGLVNATGVLTERYEYTPYGQRKVFTRGWLLADVNDDGVVNSADYDLINAGYSASQSSTSRLDLNGDGTDDTIDFNLYAVQTGQSLAANDPNVFYPTVSSFRKGHYGDAAGAPLCEFGHQGLMHDEEFGLVYNRARMLVPDIGKFGQRDPRGYVNSENLSEYERGSPIRAFDSSGTESCFECPQKDCERHVNYTRGGVG